MKQTNFLYKEPILSWDKALVKQGILKGRLSGFDVCTVALSGSNYLLNLSHSASGLKHINSAGVDEGGIGNFVSPQGVSHVTTETVVIYIPKNTDTSTRRDLLYAEVQYIYASGDNLPTYGSVQGVAGSNVLPPLGDPKKGVSLAGINVKGIGSGSMSIGDIQFIPTPILNPGGTAAFEFIKNNLSMTQADNHISAGVMISQENINIVKPDGDETDNDINNRPVLTLKTPLLSNTINLLPAVDPNATLWITDISIIKDKHKTTRPFDNVQDFAGVALELINSTGKDVYLGIPDGVTQHNTTIASYLSSPYILKSGDNCTIRRVKSIWGITFWKVDDMATQIRVIGDPDTQITSETYINHSNNIQSNLSALDSALAAFYSSIINQLIISQDYAYAASHINMGNAVPIFGPDNSFTINDWEVMTSRPYNRSQSVQLLTNPGPTQLLRDYANSNEVRFMIKQQFHLYIDNADLNRDLRGLLFESVGGMMGSFISVVDSAGAQMYFGFPNTANGNTQATFLSHLMGSSPRSSIQLNIGQGQTSENYDVNGVTWNFEGFTNTDPALVNEQRAYHTSHTTSTQYVSSYPKLGDGTNKYSLTVTLTAMLSLKLKFMIIPV